MWWSTPEKSKPCPRAGALAKVAYLLIHECSFPEPFDVTNHRASCNLMEQLLARRLTDGFLLLHQRGKKDLDDMGKDILPAIKSHGRQA
ncbi:MAG: hypothetical protein NTX42_03965 [Methanothrix sp.]|nr:hypothetical protein [Methanothrix sp.]